VALSGGIFYSGGAFAKDAMQYRALLHRGWEVVRLDYTLEDDAVVMQRKGTFKAAQTERVELASLSGEVRRVAARQPAYVYSTFVVVAVLIVLGIDAIMHGVVAQQAGARGISWWLWGPLLAVGGYAWVVRFKTRKPAEWSHFLGTNKGGGLFVLRDPKNARGHELFVAEVRKRLPEGA
jgi:hypothetical protein